MNHEYEPAQSYLRVATACPEVSVGDVDGNVEGIQRLYSESCTSGTSLVVFPELSVTGYTLGDVVMQTELLDAAEQGIAELASATKGQNTAMIVGAPLRHKNRLYNCAVVLADGEIKGVVPKTNLPTYGEFYEDRWYATPDGAETEMVVNGGVVPFGTDLLFTIGGVQTGVEICEDLWVGEPPSGRLIAQGALLIANPSASPEQIGKASYRHDLVALQSGRLIAGYVYAGCDSSESTAEIVMGGHQLVASNGHVIAERQPFGDARLTIADIDIDHLQFDRRRQQAAQRAGARVIATTVTREQSDVLTLPDSHPFLPAENAVDRDARLQMIMTIQARGLAERMRRTGGRLVLGLSGGLDSTLALLVACEAARMINRNPAEAIMTLTMPGPASSDHTQNNAVRLAKALGVRNKVIGIDHLVDTELKAIGHSRFDQDITYENTQARVRTSLLFNFANQAGAIVLGTGDLSEIALGWSTYNGDQQSHYNVNASIPKTLVKSLVAYAAELPQNAKAKRVLTSILKTVISPELTGTAGELSQSTEDIIGPYELHDFFLYHAIRWGDRGDKVRYLAGQAFKGAYDSNEIDKWFTEFSTRFARNQFKRDNMPNGPKVGSVSLSPRGDWRMPSDMATRIWG